MVDWNGKVRAPNTTHRIGVTGAERTGRIGTLRWRTDTGLVTCIAGSIVNGHRPAVKSTFRLVQVAELKSDLILPASLTDLLGPANVLRILPSPRAQPWSA
ncbi:hypothetical protein BDW66DRAFT_157695 [Aspergillus desertorum]